MWNQVCDYISLDPKIERTDKMITINIDKLEDLKNKKWEYNGKRFFLEPTIGCTNSIDFIFLSQKDYIFIDGDCRNRVIEKISLKNLSELEFYGLKVVLNEKPKLTREEKDLIEKEIYIARNKNYTLYIYFGKPNSSKFDGEWCPDISGNSFKICSNLYPFITWESGKAWSKSELLELEVVE